MLPKESKMEEHGLMKWLERISAIAGDYFALWVILASIVSLIRPSIFLFALPHIRLILGIIMFGMGMTLSLDDFKRILMRPRAVVAGVGAQYVIMPLLAFVIARALRLSPELAVGVVLLGCCPGGTASNVITFLAWGDVALSVGMTLTSTLLSPLMTPVLTLWLAGKWMDVPASDLFLSIVQIVLLPVVLGVVAHCYFKKVVERSTKVLPLVSVIAIVVIVGAIVGKSGDRLMAIGMPVFVAVVLHNGLGLLLGFGVGRTLKMRVPQRRALAIEVGMQNSGLAVALAAVHFTPVAALPAALFSVWHNVSGPLLATWWVWKGKRPPSPPGPRRA
jgi:BASS family bile acid:Na+ symporter